MFDWFTPRCPVGSEEKAWIEDRLRWLTLEFGLERLRKVRVILPTPEFFPDPYDGSRKAGRRMFKRVCDFMGLNQGGLVLDFYEGEKPLLPDDGEIRHGAAGLYEGGDWEKTIWIEASRLSDPLGLVATLAHELGHAILLGQQRLSENTPDHEPLTDLLTVFLGFGVFTANSRVRSTAWRDGTLEGWRIERLGYLGQEAVGYALSLFARARGEQRPAWASHLCTDVRSYFKKGLRYLQKTGDSSFDPDNLSVPPLSPPQDPDAWEKLPWER
jgi:hypothetical protein